MENQKSLWRSGNAVFNNDSLVPSPNSAVRSKMKSKHISKLAILILILQLICHLHIECHQIRLEIMSLSSKEKSKPVIFYGTGKYTNRLIMAKYSLGVTELKYLISVKFADLTYEWYILIWMKCFFTKRRYTKFHSMNDWKISAFENN